MTLVVPISIYFFERDYRKVLILNITKFFVSPQQNSSKDYVKDDSIHSLHQETVTIINKYTYIRNKLSQANW